MRTTGAVTIAAMLGTLFGAAVHADPGQEREPSIAWLEDRYTESWSWVLRDAPVEIAGVVWTLEVRAQIRDHGRRLTEPSINLMLTSPTPQAGYMACNDFGLILNGEALQGIGVEWSYRQKDGRNVKSAALKVSADQLRRMAVAKTVEARLCGDEFVVDPPILASLRALLTKVRSGPPPAAERRRTRDAPGG